MAEAIARTERTPETLAGCCGLGILSASIGAGLQIIERAKPCDAGKSLHHGQRGIRQRQKRNLPARGKTVFSLRVENGGTLAGGNVARPSGGRGHAGKRNGQAEKGSQQRRSWVWNGKKSAIELQAKKKALADVNEKLNPPRLCCEDVTSEKLAVMLAQNQEQLASLSPDAGSIVNNLLGRYSKLDRTDEGIYLKAFSGDNCRVDRQGREPVLLQRPCLAALWLVQPDKVETLLAKAELTDGGMIPRLLVCHSRALPRPIVDGSEGIPADTADAWAALVGKSD